MSTESQVRAIYALLGKHGLRDEKDSIVKSFTANRTNSVRAMNWHEAAALIGHLKSLDPKELSSDKMKSKILSYAHEMNWRIPGTTVIDMDHVNNWMLGFSYLKKKLDDYTYTELPKLVSQFEEVYKSHLKKL